MTLVERGSAGMSERSWSSLILSSVCTMHIHEHCDAFICFHTNSDDCSSLVTNMTLAFSAVVSTNVYFLNELLEHIPVSDLACTT